MKILFICTGNTCRSPMAKELFKAFLKSKNINNINCDSAGISAKNNEPAAKNAIKALRDIDIDLSSHKAKNIFDIDLKKYDLFVTMNFTHYEILKSFGIPNKKIYVLGNQIQDPYNGDIDTYIKCRNNIDKALPSLYKYLESKLIVKK